MNQIPTQVTLLNCGFALYKQSASISEDPEIQSTRNKHGEHQKLFLAADKIVPLL
jgi:hypothetical protein